MNHSSTRFPIPSTYSRVVARILGLQERELPTLLQGTDLPIEILLPGDETYLSGKQQLVVLENALRLMESPDFGLRLGQQLKPAAHGPLGYLALSSHDLLSALQSLADYLPMRLPVVALKLELDDTWLSCKLTVKLDAGGAVQRAISESFSLVIQSLVEAVMGRDVPEATVKFTHPAPDYASLYSNFLHCPYQFACSDIVYRLPADLAHTPNTTGDPQAYRLAQQLCTRLLKQTPNTGRNWSDRVRTLLLAQPQGSVSEEDVARSMFVSKRTLARRLEREGTSYRAIRENTLSELGKRYLMESRLTVESVAATLGYNDPAAFRKAFRRWTGMTPGEFRRH